MTWVAALVAVAAGAGLAAGRRWQDGAPRLARRLLEAILYVLAPPIVFVSFARLEVSVEVGAGIVLAWVSVALAAGTAYLAARRLGLDRPATGSLMAAAAHPNTGFLGLPLCVALLGTEHLDEAIAFDVLVASPVFLGGVLAIAAGFGARAGEGARERVRAFLVRNPPLWAAVAGLLAPDALAPDWLYDAVKVLVLSLAPIGFFAAGALLSRERGRAPRRVVATGVALRLIVAPGIFLAFAMWVIDVPDAYKLQMAMPVGINSLAAAHAFGLDTGLTATAIAWTTGIVVLAALAVSIVA